MKGLVVVDKGLEEVAVIEIAEKIKSKGKVGDTIVSFPIKNEKELCRLAYTSQSVRRVLLLIKEFKVDKNLEKSVAMFKKNLSKSILKEYSGRKINVECERIGEHDFSSVDFSKEAGRVLYDFGFKILRKENDLTFYVYIKNDKGYFCLDFSGRDLSKREYRIFMKPGSLKGTLGYALVRFSKYKSGEIFVDPYCESGIIPIEAALMSMNKPVNFYKKDFPFKKIDKKFEKVFDKENKKIKKKVKGIHALDKVLRNIHSSKKNAKIAGVGKNIGFSKADMEWLDTKFEKGSVDKIVTKLPAESKRHTKKQIEKIYEELFYQSEFILKDKGSMVICTLRNNLLKDTAKKKNFKVIDEKTIYSGQQEHCVTIFVKQKRLIETKVL